MFALINDDGSLAFAEGTVGGENVVEVPEHMEMLARNSPNQIVWLGNRFADAKTVTAWYVDDAGTRRAYKVGENWRAVTGPWNGLLIRDGDGWKIETRDEIKRLELHAAAARLRKARERAGIVVDGFSVPTDDETRVFLIGAYAAASTDETFNIPSWKIEPGIYVQLGREQIIEIGQAVLAHVQECFSINQSADEKIISGEVANLAQLEALFV